MLNIGSSCVQQLLLAAGANYFCEDVLTQMLTIRLFEDVTYNAQ
jgi:hypothetical protein